jgi:hypothetical protein
MKVFISWSGETSRAMAEQLRDWLPLVLHYVEPWMSDVDIDAGDRWADSVAKELEASNFGVICVTRENVSSPWILFEAGALAKSLKSSRVIPLLLDLDFQDISGPLAQFQAKKVEKVGIGEVVQSINQSWEEPDDQNRATQLFEALWRQLEAGIEGIPMETEPAKRARPQAEVLEELVASVRSLEARMREISQGGGPPRRRRGPKQTMMLADLAHMSMDGPQDPIMLLAAASMLKESVPWIYELGAQAYRASIEGAPHADRMVQQFLRSVEVVQHSPMLGRNPEVDPRALDMLLMEALRFAHRPRVRADKENLDEGDGQGDDDGSGH